MKRITATFAVLTTFLCLAVLPTITHSQSKPPSLEAHFSPHGGCTDAYIRELNKVQNTILVQAYPFTSGPIAKALVNTHKRGVKVEVILDKSHIEKKKKYSSGTFFLNPGIAQAAGLF